MTPPPEAPDAPDPGADPGPHSATDEAFSQLLESYSSEVRELATKSRALIQEVVPDAAEEVDATAKILGFTFIPGTYKGLIVAISPQKNWVNIMFSKGVELMELDTAGLLEGTGKVARHIKVRDAERLAQPEMRALIAAAAARTPR